MLHNGKPWKRKKSKATIALRFEQIRLTIVRTPFAQNPIIAPLAAAGSFQPTRLFYQSVTLLI
jgi:hypothetical protein